jgi:hypothetical protein
VAIGLAVPSNDDGQHLMELDHILRSASIQRILHHRLLGAAGSSKGALQAYIGLQPFVDFHQSLCPSRQADKGCILTLGQGSGKVGANLTERMADAKDARTAIDSRFLSFYN